MVWEQVLNTNIIYICPFETYLKINNFLCCSREAVADVEGGATPTVGWHIAPKFSHGFFFCSSEVFESDEYPSMSLLCWGTTFMRLKATQNYYPNNSVEVNK